MGALYYQYSPGKELFKQQVGISPVKVDVIDSLVGKANMAIYTDITAQINETIQFFLTFDDLVKYFHFGKGLGSISISGMIFSNCEGSMPGLTKMYSILGQNRGKLITVSFGSMWFQGVMTSVSTSIVGEPDTIASFNIQLAVTNHGLSTIPPTSSC